VGISGGLENEVGVLDRIAGADQPDGPGDALLEGGMRLEQQRNAGETRDERLLPRRVVVVQKLLGGEDATDLEVGPERVEHLEHGGHVVDQGEVDGFNLRPEREAAVGDDEGVGVAHARQQAEDGGIENAGFEHEGREMEEDTSRSLWKKTMLDHTCVRRS